MNDFSNFVEKLKNEDKDLRIELDASDRYAEIILKIIDFRKKHKITQAQIAERTGLKQSAVARLERMDNYVRADTLIKVMNALGLELDVSVPGSCSDWAACSCYDSVPANERKTRYEAMEYEMVQNLEKKGRAVPVIG